jgi:hypothetical protein
MMAKDQLKILNFSKPYPARGSLDKQALLMIKARSSIRGDTA